MGCEVAGWNIDVYNLTDCIFVHEIRILQTRGRMYECNRYDIFREDHQEMTSMSRLVIKIHVKLSGGIMVSF